MDCIASPSKAANLYAAEVFALVQEYKKAARYLKRQGEKLSPYTKQESDILNQISELNLVTGDQDANAVALRSYASFLLVRNCSPLSAKDKKKILAVAQTNYLLYLEKFSGVTELKLLPQEEIFLLKTFLDNGFDPILFLRLQELDPEGAKQIRIKAKELIEPPKTEQLKKLPKVSWEVTKKQADINLI